MASDARPDKERVKWYLRPVTIFIAIIAIGPLAIPLVWISPALKKWHKIALTAVIAFLTLWMVKASIDLYRILSKEIENLKEVLK